MNIVKTAARRILAKSSLTPEQALEAAERCQRECGNLSASGKLTAKGRKRDAMTPVERAVDREAKRRGVQKSSLVFDKSSKKVRKRCRE